MQKYINFGEYKINKDTSIEEIYSKGYVLTRKPNIMNKVRSVRVCLDDWEPSSENRRILKKFDDFISLSPLQESNFDWHVSKLVKDFYNSKFGAGVFSANKASFLLKGGSNFNTLLKFSAEENSAFEETDGYCITYFNDNILHYAYPFYKLSLINSNFGIYMMTKTIEYCKNKSLKYIYLGSAHEKSALYKFQFKGIEWFDEVNDQWSKDIDLLKNKLK